MQQSKYKELADKAGRLLISTEEFNNLLTLSITHVKKYLTDSKHNAYMPELLIYSTRDEDGKRGLTVMAFADFPEGEDKRKLLMGAGAKLAEEKGEFVSCIFMIHEAWVAEATKDFKGAPSEHPNRKECMVVSGLTIDGRSNMAFMDVVRDNDNHIELKDEVKETPYEEDMKNAPEPLLLHYFMKGYIYVMTNKGLKTGGEPWRN